MWGGELKTFDIIIVSGDAYVDHPSFGAALIRRFLESKGFKVGIIPQPDWKSDKDFLALGKPNLFFAVTAGNLDSMVNNYTADKKVRRDDMYSPNGEAGHRPDRASIIYTNKLKQLFPGSIIVLGGVEASLRRFAHYDFWDDKVRRSLLFDSKADLLFYGMSEQGIWKLADSIKSETLNSKQAQNSKFKIPNSAIIKKDISEYKDYLLLPSYEEVSTDKRKYAEAFKLYSLEYAKRHPRTIIQPCQGRFLVVYPPENLSQEEFEGLFKLPFTRESCCVPAFDFVKFSTISHRGCFGGCSFCAITNHQGKYIQSRSETSIKDEIQNIIMKQKDFKGNILDIGGPTANMYKMECKSPEGCARVSCIYPTICKNLDTNSKPMLKMLKQIRELPGMKHVFINSGIRYDLALLDPDYMEELVRHHVGGQLSVAPEHICEEVLLLMKKPKFDRFLKFKKEFERLNQKHGKRQFLIPYFISSHPGTTLNHMLELALFLKKNNIRVQQVQNFTPTPMTAATCMYYTGLDPYTGKPVHVPKGEERSLQRALLQPYLEKNKRQVMKALTILGKRELARVLLNKLE
ncbi:YgiQ family radical SAM protein [candidate division WOR-1 bacterium RIFOXYA12_FULL_43_27]|uniref:YgiQ family radical SAM protein n=1 Tax=candidate division WOR-1 bacterium RIFOXYC2_FULL_46_14 TaxID=1802587 RepID=A0A1F4U7I4_UNCSA|nr:MAG: YgiQ family radical SAM protein [candidate division WOR-1 bacterium RIFOXYA12_FULL_43_27]OGC19328.1 MAG: YgiQ family radical SAM protein [candidate division WOR-1 bacterium RIFOXYB2_FULL_46_45]OGC30317.1 MAG: YgiQ family radical SAM protein [candidate division WOR-1 bacterium RIFOXYA2_FULL_46_56]OGC40918.1 MAG: YgiQ family radical SAM protein [candidate division WOR-1 bacterium RIFOXYC2_FULL_46_14]